MAYAIKTTKIHRKYPKNNWEYKAIGTKVGNNEVIYGISNSDGKKSEGVEVYSGKNYDIDSTSPSYSKRYELKDLPKKYQLIVEQLKKKHQKTKWSNAERVDLN